MYHRNKTTASRTTINRNKSYKGETIEQKVHRIVNNREPITDGAPVIYTDRKDGVIPTYDIRTDNWELAVDQMDLVTKNHLAKREENRKAFEEKLINENRQLNQNNNNTGDGNQQRATNQ